MSSFIEKKLPVIPVTQDQSDYLDELKDRTGKSYAAIVRDLIQDKIDGK